MSIVLFFGMSLIILLIGFGLILMTWRYRNPLGKSPDLGRTPHESDEESPSASEPTPIRP